MTPVHTKKKVKQAGFQFSYDPLNKRFIRELRDLENKEYIIDKHFLGLKALKEQYKTPEGREADRDTDSQK